VRTLLVLALVACGGAARTGTSPPKGDGKRGVEAAALPFKILEAKGGREVPEADFFRALAASRAVCVGESHKNPHHHWAQLRVVQEIGGSGWALGMEMFQRPVQGVLDDFRAGTIDEAALLSRSGWADRWGYDYGLYRPMIEVARARKMGLLALNAPQELTKKVAHQGLVSLSPEERATVPELDLKNEAHRSYFQDAMQGHDMGDSDFENFYAAQVLWDETMADTAWRWLAAGAERRVVILAGTGHCHDSAIPGRLRRRGADRVLSVHPVIDDGEGNVSDLLASPENDYLFVMSYRRATAAAPRAPKAVPADPYRDAAAHIIAAALKDDGAWAKLEHLADRVGARMSGSKALEAAIVWAASAMKADGHQNVRTEKVMVPSWQRGAESGEIVAPVRQPLHLLALGSSPGTPRKGLAGDVVVVSSFDELEALGREKVEGKIVLFNHPLPPYSPDGSHYSDVVPYRGTGPARASRLGAIGALVRSVTAHSLRSPHTGSTRFEATDRAIPAAAVSIEDAELIVRLVRAGETVRVKLSLGAKQGPDVPSANVLGEIVGRERPNEIVLIGAHIDSWDVGQGAHDDGAGCAIVMQALTILRKLDLRPRRTIRVVLFTNEENGLRGATAYADAHKAELASHVAAIEADSGAFKPLGFSVQGAAKAVERATAIAQLLGPIEATEVEAGHGGADVGVLAPAGVPLLGLTMDGATYFDYHHSEADTLDKVEPQALKMDVAAMAVMAYVLADMPGKLADE
jgi:carboxypeptidase Q